MLAFFCPYNDSVLIVFIVLQEFMGSSPSLIQIKSEIQYYDSVEQEIDAINPEIVFGSTELSTGKQLKVLLFFN